MIKNQSYKKLVIGIFVIILVTTLFIISIHSPSQASSNNFASNATYRNKTNHSEELESSYDGSLNDEGDSIVSIPPYYGYTTFKGLDDPDLSLEDLSTYTSFLHVRHRVYYHKDSDDFLILEPTVEGLERVRGTNLKLILKLNKYLVEPVSLEECCDQYGIPEAECTENFCGFNEEELLELKNRVDPYKDLIEAIYVINEPYKPINNYTEAFLQNLVQDVKGIFTDYKMYVNFLSPFYRSHQIPGEFPGIPENIDIIAFDAYFTPEPDQESWYKTTFGNDIAIIKARANGRPVIFSSLAYRMDTEPPEGPDSRPELYQVDWDYDLFRIHNLAGLRWFFYDERSPTGNWYGATYWPDLIDKHKEIGQLIFEEGNEFSFNYLPMVFSSDPSNPPGSPTVISDILYGDAENGERNLLDLYIPSDASGPYPVIIWVHGGGMSTGDKTMAGQGIDLVREGFALVGINYRLNPDDYLPTQIFDVKAAVRWVRANADQYNLDSDNIGIIGGSAGAIMTASIGTTGDVPEAEGTVGDHLGYSSRVHAVVPMAGVYNFVAFFPVRASMCEVGNLEDQEDCYLEWFVGCSLVYQSCWDAVNLSSAINHVSPDDPPFYLCFGDQDPTPNVIEDHTAFNNALLSQGVESTLSIVPGGEHGECYEHRYEEILAFFNLHLKD